MVQNRLEMKVMNSVAQVNTLSAGSVGNIAEIKVTNGSVYAGTGTPAPYLFSVHIKFTVGGVVVLDAIQLLMLGPSEVGTVSKTFDIPASLSGGYQASAWLNTSNDSLMIVQNGQPLLVTVNGNVVGATGTLSGHVYQSAIVYPGPALSGVNVSVGGLTAVTDANGYYNIAGITQGSYTVSFSKAGFITNSIAINIGPGANTQDFDIAPSTVTITGQTRGGTLVDGSDSVPLAGVSISVAGGWSGTSDANGNFAIPGITYQNYTITFTKAGYVTQTQTIVMFPGSGTQMVVHMLAVVVPPQGTVSFTYGPLTVTEAPDPAASAFTISQVSCLVTNPSSSPITRNFVCMWQDSRYPGSWYTRGWGWTRPLSLTLQPGQSATLVSPYADAVDMSIQQVQSGFNYYFVDDLGKASTIVHA